MVPEISEFSFGYAITSEFVHVYQVAMLGAPRFPTQAEEGGPEGGYDLQFPRHGAPIFFQFKRSDCLTTRKALDHASLGLPYYRFKLMRRDQSDQHALLLQLEQLYPDVYYVFPRFHLQEELDHHFIARTVVEGSTFVRPSEIGTINDDAEHSFSVAADGLATVFRSEPRRGETVLPAARVADIRRRARARRMRLDLETILSIGDQLLALSNDRPAIRRYFERRALRNNPLEALQNISQMMIGAQMMFVLIDDA